MTTGIKTNPQWYPGLTAKSSFAEFQCELAQKKGGDCEGFIPCINKGKCKATTSVAAGGCKAATKGKDRCWGHVNWAMTTGIKTNPQWYPGLTANSSFAEFQCEIAQPTAHHGKKGGDCEGFIPCINKGKCAAAKGNCKAATKGKDKCWGHVNWAMTTGIKTNPQWYPGLTAKSSFAGFTV